MATCPSGHQSADDDFCDVCGFAIGPVGNPSTIPALIQPGAGASAAFAGPAGAGPAGVGSAGSDAGGSTATAVLCPQCSAPRAGQFCESCGYDFTQLGSGSAQRGNASAQPGNASAQPGNASAQPGSGSGSAQPGNGSAQPGNGQPGNAQPSPSPWVTRVEPAPAPPPPLPPSSAPSAAPPSPAPPTVPPASAAPAPASAAAASAAAAPSRPAPPAAPAAPAAPGAAWTAVVTADRAYYDSVQASAGPGAEDISFPVYCPQRRFRLETPEVRVGRRSARSGIEPEIDLTGPPADPGVSRLHAVLLRGADGSWSVVDPGSANGTLVNGTEIARDELVPLHDGDRINLGAWTELRIITEA